MKNTRYQIKGSVLRIVITSFLLLCTSLPTHSIENKLRQFAMFAAPNMAPDNCQLVERYSPHRTNGTRFNGYIDSYGCNVSIPTDRYEKLFRFCYQSGINVHKITNENSFECFIQKRVDDYLFLSHISKAAGKDSQVMCYFSCIAQ